MVSLRKCRIGVVGLGYVGLPLAVEFGKHYETVGFDIKPERIAELSKGRDSTLEVSRAELKASHRLSFTSELAALRKCRVFIVTVPTPIDNYKRPDLTPLVKASETLGKVLKKGDIVIYESTVYPGCTEEECVPVLERVSGLTFNRDFFAGYSPERINPGDKQHRVTTIRKVTSGSTPEVAEFVDKLYGSIITAGTHKASSIKVAEAAKVIENTQRDVNIALINELALIFNRLGIDTEEVLLASGTKWNFLPFRPGLVGGHCIGVDPYYLTHKAQEIGYHPEMIRGPAPERQHGALCRGRGRAAHDGPAHPREGLESARARAHVQGELPRHPQFQGGRCGARAGEVRRASRRARPVGRLARGAARVRHQAGEGTEGARLRRRGARRGAPAVQGSGCGCRAALRAQECGRLRHQVSLQGRPGRRAPVSRT
jgi:hypothetical protein